MNTHTKIVDLEQGFRISHMVVNKFFANVRWMMSNLTASHRRDLDPLLHHLIKVIDLLDLRSADGMSLDVWYETRDELETALAGAFASNELAALEDVVQRYNIPKQFLFDPLNGADLWIRHNRFATYDELLSFVGQTGGAWLTSVVPVLGAIKPHYEADAIDCGKAVMLTQLLANLVPDAKNNRIFLAEEDLNACEIEIQRLKLRKSMPNLKHLVRLYCWRIEKLLDSGSHLLGHLDFDGRRSLTSLLGWTWTTMNQMRINPESILNESGVLSRRDIFMLKAKHLMGLEGRLPFDVSSNNHH
jgi:phytoene synthase